MVNIDDVKTIAGNVAAGTSPYETRGTVQSVMDGTAYVVFDGATHATPVDAATCECAPGDTVYVRVSHYDTHVTGNATQPSASGKTVAIVGGKAEAAAENAETALDAAEAAQAAAQRTASYFWHDSTGAHVSDQPNSTDGKHITIDSDSVDICIGERVLATFKIEEGNYPRGVLEFPSYGGRVRFDPSGDMTMYKDSLGFKIDGKGCQEVYLIGGETGSNWLRITDTDTHVSGDLSVGGTITSGLPQQVKAVDFSHTGSSGTASSFTNAVTFDGGEGWVAVGVLDTYTSRYGVCPIAGARITAGSGTQSGTVTVYHYHVNSTSYTDVADTVRVLFRRA